MINTIPQIAAIYCRLSRDDGTETDSSSIISQKESLTIYAKNNGWEIYDYYIDDGFSGTNFNRPAFNRLLDDIENKKINIIITKDLSRLGRNYLQTGYYTEEYFPENNIRYIAVNDNYDSTNDDNDFTPFKNIINEWYAKDISKKIKSSFRHKMNEGSLLLTPPYGYINDKQKGRIIDLEVAPIIQFIFNEYVYNFSTSALIAKALTKQKILIPGYYRYKKFGNKTKRFTYLDEEQRCLWTRHIIKNILETKEYTGCLIYNKTQKLSFKSKKRIITNNQNWLIFEDKYEPIISKETFKLAEEYLSKNKKAGLPASVNKYRDLLICKDCGKPLKLQRTIQGKQEFSYLCKTKGCTSKKIHLHVLDQIIQNEITEMKQTILKNEKEVIEYVKQRQKIDHSKDINNKIIDELNKRSNEIDLLIKNLFDFYIKNEIHYSTYENLLSQYKHEKDEIETKLSIIKIPKTNNDNNMINEFITNLKSLDNMEITRKLLVQLIDKIIVSQEQKSSGRYIPKHFQIIYKGLGTFLEDFLNGKLNE